MLLASVEFKPNATYPKGLEDTGEYWDLDMVQAIKFALNIQGRMRIIGDPGTGKTSFVKGICRAFGLDIVYIPAATIRPEDLAVPMPVKSKNAITGEEEYHLDFLLYRKLTSQRPKVILIDELSRASTQVRNQLLEMTQELRLADIPIPNVMAVIALDNEGVESGIRVQPDFATVDRWYTVQVDPNKVPWRWHLAADSYPNTDLKAAYRVYGGLSPRERFLFSPRVFDHVVYCALKGFPLIWGLPMQAGEGRCRIVNDNGQDRTDEILTDMARALGVENRDNIPDALPRALKAAIEDGVNIYIEGDPGIGKTAYIREVTAASGYPVKIFSAPVISPDNLVVPFPRDGELDLMTERFLAQDGEKILGIDEVWRCTEATRNKLMEILMERTIGGVPTNVRCVIAMNNPKMMGSYRLDVGRADRAQVERFTLSIAVQPNEVPAKRWLIENYGEDAEHVTEWHEDNLADEAKAVTTRRAMQRLIECVRADMPLEWAIPWMNGARLPVPLHELEAIFADRPPARLRAIAAKTDEYVKRLQDPDDAQAQWDVYQAFSHAEIPQLKEHEASVIKMFRWMLEQNQVNLMRGGQERQSFWYEVLRAAKGHLLDKGKNKAAGKAKK